MVSDKATDLIARDQLIDLLRASMRPDGRRAIMEDTISPLAILFVIAMLATLFVSIIRLA